MIHPWLGPLVLLDDLLASPVPGAAPSRLSRGALPVWERQEPVWATSSSAGRSSLDRFFTTPLTAERPVLALWWGLPGHDRYGLREDQVPLHGITDARMLAWMTQGIGGKDLAMASEPAFHVDTCNPEWRALGLPLSEADHDRPTRWSDRVGVWCCREQDRLLLGMGAQRWCLDRRAGTFVKTFWSSGEGWVEGRTLRDETEWFDLMGLKAWSSKAHRKGWANQGLNRAMLSLALPDHDRWDTTRRHPWMMCSATDVKDRVTMVAVMLPQHPDDVDRALWEKDFIAHAHEWNDGAEQIQHHLRRIARAARRGDPAIARWARWLWSNPVNGDRLDITLENGWTHAQAWEEVRQDAGGAAEWVKQASPFLRSTTVWRNGHALSDASLGHHWCTDSWHTPAGRRWARRQTAPAIRTWLRLQFNVASGDQSVITHVHEWGELLARWNVPRFPTWAVRALTEHNLLRKSVTSVLRDELNDLPQPSWEQQLLREALATRRPPAPLPVGLRWLLRAWVRDVMERPWSARRDEADPLGLNVWTVAFQRASSEPPIGHERWSWSRWKHWVMQDEEWERWLITHAVLPGGLIIEQDGWCVTGLARSPGTDSPEDPLAAWPLLPHAQDASPAGNVVQDDEALAPPFNMDDWMNDWAPDQSPEAWTVVHPDHGSMPVVLRKTRKAWTLDPDRTPVPAHAVGTRWAQVRAAMENLGTVMERAERPPGRAARPARPGTDLSPRLVEAAMNPLVTTDLPLALGRLDMDGWTLTPVASAQDLKTLARLMANCVGDGAYEPWMEAGQCRLFVVRGSRLKVPALIDLRYSPADRAWAMHQVEGRDNTTVAWQVHAMARNLAMLYTALCPDGHAPTVNAQRLPPRILRGFDADTATLVEDLCADATGRNRDVDVSGNTLNPFTTGNPEVLTEMLVALMNGGQDLVRMEPLPPETTDMVQRIVDEMYARQSPDGQPTVYQRGVDPEVDLALDHLGQTIPPGMTWWGLTDMLFEHGRPDVAHRALRHAVPDPENVLEPDGPMPSRHRIRGVQPDDQRGPAPGTLSLGGAGRNGR